MFSAQSNTIVLLGSSLDGHQESYTSEFVEMALKKAPNVALLLNQTVQDTDELAKLKVKFSGRLKLVIVPDGVFFGLLRSMGQKVGQFINLYIALRRLKELRIGSNFEVWIICLDYFFWPVVLTSLFPRFGVRFGLLIQSQFTRMKGIRGRLSLVAHSLAWRVLTRKNSEFTAIYLDKSQGLVIKDVESKRHKVRYVRAPVTALPLIPRREARAMLDLPSLRPLILVYGRVSSRKNLRGLLEVLYSSPAECHATVIVAGVIDHDQLELIANASSTITPRIDFKIYGRRVSSEEERALFCACDLVWLNYSGHQTVSGVYDLSLAYGRVVAVPIQWRAIGLIAPNVNAENIIYCDSELASMSHLFWKRLKAAQLRTEEVLAKCSEEGLEQVGTWKEVESEVTALRFFST